MSGFLADAWNGFRFGVELTAWAGAVGCVVELLLRGERQSPWAWLHGLRFGMTYGALAALFYALSSQVIQATAYSPPFPVHIGWIAASDFLPLRIGGLLLAAFLATAFVDFFYYWFHRLQHRSRFLWRFHSVHHSIVELNTLNNFHHFSEELLRYPFVSFPAALLMPVDPGLQPMLLVIFLRLQGQLIHTNTRLDLWWLRPILVDNRMHRIHHSMEMRHRDRNFGAFTGLWDVLFRTAYLPGRDEYPATGVQGLDEPRRLADFLLLPFRRDRPVRPSAPPEEARAAAL